MSTTLHQTFSSASYEAPRHAGLFGGTIARLVKGLLDTILLWQQRANDRTRLRGMNQHLLADIGISEAEARFESAKPFWRD